MGLRVVDHLQAMLDLPVMGIKLGQFARLRARDPVGARQRGQRLDRAPVAQARVAPARHQLPGLGEELDLADAARAELDVVPLQRDLPVAPDEALVLADAAAHVHRVLHHREVEMPPPDEGGSVSRNRSPAAMSPAAARALI
jgi:hypothetical protein